VFEALCKINTEQLMLEFLVRNQDAFIVGFIFLVAGSGLGSLWAALQGRNKSIPKIQPKQSLPEIVEQSAKVFYVPLEIRANNGYSSKRNNQDDVLPFIYVAIVLLCGLYIYWRYEVLIALTSISFFLISFFSSASLYAYIKDQIGGNDWIIYLSAILFVSFFSFILILSALQPEYAPDGFSSIQQIFRDHGVKGLIKLLTLESIPWLVSHVIGVFFLVYMQFRMASSLVHYTSIVRIGSTGKIDGLAFQMAKLTKKYRSPYKNIFILIFLSVISYYFINGYAYILFNSFIGRP
jgi:hypothetical protein